MDNFRFTCLQRLKSPADFQRVYKSKQWGGSQHYTYNVRATEPDVTKSLPKNNSLPAEPPLLTQAPVVLGVTASKKVSKRAVDRNRIKRQVREFVRLKQHQLHNAELIVTAKPSCLKASDLERYNSLEELWSKVMKWQRWQQRQTLKKRSELIEQQRG